MIARFGFWRIAFLICLVSSFIWQTAVSGLSYPQAGEQIGDFSVEVLDDEIHVIRIDSTGMEIFKVVVLKNGRISEIVISFKVFATSAGWSADPYDQVSGSNSTAEPIVQNMGDYVSLVCFARFSEHPLSVVTNMTICGNGLILVHATLKAEEDALLVQQVSWGLSGFPISLFQGHKAYAQVEGRELQEINLPLEHVTGAQAWDLMRSETIPAYWVDFSQALEGITFVNVVPSLTLGSAVTDGREWETTVFNAAFNLNLWGQGAMVKDELNEVKVALYIHGPGGYQSVLDMINLLLDLGQAEGNAREGLESYTDAGAKSSASQALSIAQSAYSKIVTGDLASARNDIDQASDLLKQAEDTERTAAMMRDLTLAAIPIIAVVVLVIVLKMRRRQ